MMFVEYAADNQSPRYLAGLPRPWDSDSRDSIHHSERLADRFRRFKHVLQKGKGRCAWADHFEGFPGLTISGKIVIRS